MSYASSNMKWVRNILIVNVRKYEATCCADTNGNFQRGFKYYGSKCIQLRFKSLYSMKIA